MAMQTGGSGDSGFMKEMGKAVTGAVKAHAKDETVYGRQSLPPGIRGGIARLSEIKFSKYATGDNTGKWFVRLMGVVEGPHPGPNGLDIRGMQTSMMIPMCDTKIKSGKDAGKIITFQDHMGELMNEYRKLGCDTSTWDTQTPNVEHVAKELVEAAPAFKFETSLRAAQIDPVTKQKKGEDGVWENWFGYVDVEAPDTASYQQNGEAPTAGAEAPGGSGFNEFAGAQEAQADGEVDLDALMALVSDETPEGQAAREKIKELAMGLGMTEDDVDNADSWDAVAAKMAELSADGDAQAEAAGVTEAPAAGLAKDDVVFYQPIDPKTNKPAMKPNKKPLLVEGVIVEVKGDKATFKKLEDGKVILDKMKKPLWIPVSDFKPQQ